jgi:dTMP kinase
VSAAGGRFIVLEGLDGAGTTTQARRLATVLRAAGRAAGRAVHVTAEPSGGPVGQLARLVLTKRLLGAPGQAGFDPAALALLFAADRLDHLSVEVLPRLAAGEDVISDRYTLSSLAYQSLTTGDLAWVEALNARARTPDLTLFLRVTPDVAFARRQAENGGGELFEVPEFQREVARAYDRCVERLRERGERVVVVDGERPVEEVTAALQAAVAALG